MNEIERWVMKVQASGDVDAFTCLVRRFEGMGFATAMRRLGDPSLASDALQDAFLAAYLGMERLKTPSAFPGWFRRVVMTHADRLGRRQRATPVASFPDVATPQVVHETHEEMSAALCALPERDRLVVALYHHTGRPAHEIASYLGLSLPLVKKTLRCAHSALRRELQPMHKPPERLPERLSFYLHLRRGDRAEVTRSLLGHPALANACDLPDADPARWYLPSMGRSTPLLTAIALGDLPMCMLLLRHGADPNFVSVSGMSPLLEACLLQRYELAAELLDHGASPDISFPRSGMTPLHVAASRGDAALVRRLLRHGADPNMPDIHGKSARDWAALKGHHTLFPQENT